MITCKKCKVEKPEDQMSVWGGKPSEVCVECRSSSKNGRPRKDNGGGSPSKKKKRAKVAAHRPKAAKPPELSLPAGGFGCNARLTEEGHLQLTQENAGTVPDNVCLTRREARAIFETFGEWAAES